MAGAISPSIGSLAAASCGQRSPACCISTIVRRSATIVSRPIARSAVRSQPQPRRRWCTYTWRAGRSLGNDHGAAAGGQRGLSVDAVKSSPSVCGWVGEVGKVPGHAGRHSAVPLSPSRRAATSRDELAATSRYDVAATPGAVCGDASPVSVDRDMTPPPPPPTTTTTAVGRRQWATAVAATLSAAAAAAVTTATSSADVAFADVAVADVAVADEAVADDCSTKLTESPLGLSFCDIKVGGGDAPQKGMLVKAHYTGRLASTGRIFDSSYNRGRPIVFRVGVGEVIKGWDVGILGTEGVPAMLPGGKRTLLIPPGLGYGEKGAGCRGVTPDTCVIPPNATLIFDVDYIGMI